MKKVAIVLGLGLFLLVGTSSLFGASYEITYQGRLLESGSPAGAKSVTFEIFEAVTGGSSIWWQTQTVTPDDNGVFTATLGTQGNPIPTGYDDLWLQIKVGGTTLSPRESLTAAPFAANVGTLDELDVSGAIQGFGVVPVGTVMAWHKSLPGTPALPDGWAECNGQTISDGDSPYNGQAVPDLNTPPSGYNGGRWRLDHADATWRSKTYTP